MTSFALRLFVGFCFAFNFPLVATAQNKSLNCSGIKNGIFHIYPQNVAGHIVDIREGEFVRETKENTGDTSLYRITWLNDCTYELKYVSGNEKFSDEISKFLKKHKLVYEITSVTEDYYVYKGYMDKTSTLPVNTDTMWLTEKLGIVHNELYTEVQSLKEARVSDTSKYALLYIYRSGKITNSLGNYFIYFNDNAMLVAKNILVIFLKYLKRKVSTEEQVIKR